MYRRQFTLLVLDDDTLALNSIVEVLKQRDYAVLAAPGIDAATWFLTQRQVDLVVAAVRLRPRGGLEFLAAARQRFPALSGILIGVPGDEVLEAEARRHDVPLLVRPLCPAAFLMVVAEKIASVRQRQRWPRKTVAAPMPVWIGGAPARLVDVSYGGLRFAVHGGSIDPFSPISVDVPAAGVQVTAHLVWSSLGSDGGSWVCGAAIAADAPPAEWQQFVDRLPQAA